MELELEFADEVTSSPDLDRADGFRGEDALTCELALTPVATSVRVGRQFAAHTLTEWDVPPEPIQDAVLVVSELLTNAICHGRPPIRLRLRKANDELAIEVDDGDESMPRARTPVPEALSGRGLPIVASLSRRWQTAVTDTGKTVRSVLVIAA